MLTLLAVAVRAHVLRKEGLRLPQYVVVMNKSNLVRAHVLRKEGLRLLHLLFKLNKIVSQSACSKERRTETRIRLRIGEEFG